MNKIFWPIKALYTSFSAYRTWIVCACFYLLEVLIFSAIIGKSTNSWILFAITVLAYLLVLPHIKYAKWICSLTLSLLWGIFGYALGNSIFATEPIAWWSFAIAFYLYTLYMNILSYRFIYSENENESD